MPVVGFKSNTIFNAFILNAIATSLIAVSATSLEQYLESKIDKKTGKPIYNRAVSFAITFFTTLIGAFIIYLFMYFIFGYGSAMVAKERKTFFN